MADNVITKAECSRELGLSRARVTQLCEIGLPVRPDGKLNRMQALKWVKANVDPARGGWSEDMRPRKKAKARDADTWKELELDIPKDDRSSDYQSLPDYWRGATDMVNALRRPGNIRCIAEMVIAHGCTAAQAYGVAQLYGFLLALWMADAVSARLGKEDATGNPTFRAEARLVRDCPQCQITPGRPSLGEREPLEGEKLDGTRSDRTPQTFKGRFWICCK